MTGIRVLCVLPPDLVEQERSEVAVAGGCLVFAARNEIDCFRAGAPVNCCAMELLSTPLHKACTASTLVHLSFECSPSMLCLNKEMPKRPQSPIYDWDVP